MIFFLQIYLRVAIVSTFFLCLLKYDIKFSNFVSQLFFFLKKCIKCERKPNPNNTISELYKNIGIEKPTSVDHECQDSFHF